MREIELRHGFLQNVLNLRIDYLFEGNLIEARLHALKLFTKSVLNLQSRHPLNMLGKFLLFLFSKFRSKFCKERNVHL